MSEYLDCRLGPDPADLCGVVRRRVMMLILSSTLAVALAFGLTFYYALVASQSAVAAQIPELGSVVARMKGLLIMNTIVFAAIIAGSFVVLSAVVTARMFQPLALVHRNLSAIASGTLPRSIGASSGSEFAGLEDALRTALTVIREREREELEMLSKGRESLGPAPLPGAALEAIDEVIASKSAFLGVKAGDRKRSQTSPAEDSLFIGPRLTDGGGAPRRNREDR